MVSDIFHKRLQECGGKVSACLDAAMADLGETTVARAMRYACEGGKRLRAFLVMESARLHGVGDGFSVWPAAAVEALHGYSLVHDDLPCMDNDDLRRGRPTVHVKWDEATAVLAGDALQSFAFQMLCREETGVSPAVRLVLVQGLSEAAGGKGMVLGQAQDIAAETAPAPLTLEEITRLQANKTGALIQWSASAGAILAGADPAPMRAYSGALGQAFQIADDILDVVGDTHKTGKRVGKDAQAGKATFVSLLGLEGARKQAHILVEEAEAALDGYGEKAEGLRQAARFVISREI